jgi:hypothetical protein
MPTSSAPLVRCFAFVCAVVSGTWQALDYFALFVGESRPRFHRWVTAFGAFILWVHLVTPS